MDMESNEPRAYPPERNNGCRPKRGRGRPKGVANPNGGRRALPANERFPAGGPGRPRGSTGPNGPRGATKPLITGAAEGFKLSEGDKEHLGDVLGDLKPQEVQFALEYMVDMSANLAARRCGVSKDMATIIGCSMLNRPRVRQAVNSLLEIRAKNQALVANRLLVSLDEIAHLDIGELYDEDSCLRPMSEWPPAARQAVVGFKVKELWRGKGGDRKQVGRMVDVKMVDPIRARELLGRHMGLWGEPRINVNQTNINAQNVQINQKIELSDFTREELRLALKLGFKFEGNALDLAPELSGEEIGESVII